MVVSHTKFQTKWTEIAMKWGLRVETPFVVSLAWGEISIPVVLRDFGASNGMLLVTDFDIVRPHVDELMNLGYGFACLSEPTGVPHPDDDLTLVEMLSDWGWTGGGSPPTWYCEPAS